MRRLLFILLATLAGCDNSPDSRAKAGSDQPGWSGPREKASAARLDRSHAGDPAPGAAFENPEGEPASLADFRGKPLLLNLWATWCAPCVVEMPTLDALAAREGERLEVLTVSQ